jgi:alpha-galactosidase
MPPLGRRAVLKLAVGSAALAALPWAPGRALAAGSAAMTAQDALLSLQFDRSLRTRVAYRGKTLTPFQASEVLLLKDGSAIDTFAFSGEDRQPVDDTRHGAGLRHVFTGVSKQGIEKQVAVTFFAQSPGLALLQVRYRNAGTQPVEVAGWRSAAHELADAPGGFWSFSGTTHEDRRDWVQPLGADFDQRNTLGMDASDYGGGTPVANIWRRDVGLAVGHVEPVPRTLDLPVRKTGKGASIAVEGTQAITLAPGQALHRSRWKARRPSPSRRARRCPPSARS